MQAAKEITIVQIAPSYKPAYCYGGPTMSVAKLSEELNSGGSRTYVLTTKANGSEELMVKSGRMYTIEGVKVFYFRRITGDHTHFSPELLLAQYKIIRKAAAKNRQLVFHIHSWWNLVAMLSALLAICCKVPVIVSPRGMITSYTLSVRNTGLKYLIHQLLGGSLLKRSYIHATTRQEANNIKEHVAGTNITIIPNLVDFPELCCSTYIANHPPIDDYERTLDCRPIGGVFNLRASLLIQQQLSKYLPAQNFLERSTGSSPTQMPNVFPEQSSALKVLFLSRMDKKKGLEVLFEALSSVDFDWELRIAGTGSPEYIRQLKQLSGTLKISARISWLGHVGNEAKFFVIRSHDVLVLPSHNENFANVVIESLAVGTPVLLSEQVGLAPYVTKSDIGWVCKAEVATLRNTLIEIENNPTKRCLIRTTAPIQIRKDFDKKKIIQEYCSLYRNAINQT